MNCPTCDTKGAYVGFLTVECPNKGCMHYSDKCVKTTTTKSPSDDVWASFVNAMPTPFWGNPVIGVKP